MVVKLERLLKLVEALQTYRMHLQEFTYYKVNVYTSNIYIYINKI
jgi:hypothetical protein